MEKNINIIIKFYGIKISTLVNLLFDLFQAALLTSSEDGQTLLSAKLLMQNELSSALF